MVTTLRQPAPRTVANDSRDDASGNANGNRDNARDSRAASREADRDEQERMESRKRGIKAVTRLTREIESRLDDPEAYGQTLVKLRWQAGRIMFVTVTTEEEHK